MSWSLYSTYLPCLSFNGRCLVIGKLYIAIAWGTPLERDAG